jgi:hypothetical protein
MSRSIATLARATCSGWKGVRDDLEGTAGSCTYAAAQPHNNVPVGVEADLQLADMPLDLPFAVVIGLCVLVLYLLEDRVHVSVALLIPWLDSK